MRNLISQLLAVGPELAAFILTAPLLSSRGAYAITQGTVPSPDLDLSNLGRVALTGDFDSISVYTYQGQNENAFTTNGSQSLLTRYPNGAFQSLGLADAYIETMCPFLVNGNLEGVVVGGNFTSLGGVETQGVALWNPNTTQITALPGLSGRVRAVYCDSERNMIYVGGSFSGANSTNAIAWITGWTNLPFAGFNGPVTSIAKNGAGNIVFGGQFNGLGNTTTPKTPDGQVVNLQSGNIAAQGTTTTAGFNNASSIICSTQDGSGTTWLLADNTPGNWQGNFSFGFNPTKLRLYNTAQDGRGTKSWYFEDLNSGGILEMGYIDAQGADQSCSSQCPLPQNNSTSQDFHFVSPVGMNAFRIYVTEWYGSGGGLAGIEMFQNDIYSFAVDAFNEPHCDDVSIGSRSQNNPAGLWLQTRNNGQSKSDYLTAAITDASQVSSLTNVVFSPDIKQSGNYSITLHTPGCIQDNSCATRGQVSLTGSMTTDDAPITTTVYQTNNYDKYDQIYFGYVDINTDAFSPTVTLSPVAGQNVPLTIVAQNVQFELLASTGGLNGLFEYNPDQAVVSTDFSSSAINNCGTNLGSGALVNGIAEYQGQTIVVGNFSAAGINNVLSVANSNATSPPGSGLNSEVLSIWHNTTGTGATVFMGGNFTNTADNSSQGLNGIAQYDAGTNSWTALGAGVNGIVWSIVPLTLNVTDGNLQDCVTISGYFDQVNGFDGNPAFSAGGFAIWVPAVKNWLHNIKGTTVSITGDLVTMTMVPGFSALYGGSVSSQSLGLSNAVELVGSGQPAIQALGANISPDHSHPTANIRKRTLSNGQNSTGVSTGLFYGDSGLNITVLGGQFSATASNGSIIQDLILINDTNSQTVTGVNGLDTDSNFYAVATEGTNLWAGGAVVGTVNGHTVNGLIVYDLAAANFAPSQPPALGGTGTVVVNAISAQPSAANVFVGGQFQKAGSMPCNTLCMYDTNALQWNSPGSGLSGNIVAMDWSSDTILVIGGNLTVGGNATSIATYDSKAQTYSTFAGAAGLPGPLTAFTPARSDYSIFWAAGSSTANGSAYLEKFDGSNWVSVSGLGAGTVIQGLQVLTMTSNHGSSDLVDQNQVLALFGNINIPDFGNASVVLFNGTTLQPLILTTSQSGLPGMVGGIFVSNPQNFMSNEGHYLAVGFVVLIGLAVSLALIFFIVVAGILLERTRRKQEGYVPMSSGGMTMDRNGNIRRIPPETLFGGLREKESPPTL